MEEEEEKVRLDPATLHAEAFLLWLIAALGGVMRWWALRSLDLPGGLFARHPVVYVAAAIAGPVIASIAVVLAVALHVAAFFRRRRPPRLP